MAKNFTLRRAQAIIWLAPFFASLFTLAGFKEYAFATTQEEDTTTESTESPTTTSDETSTTTSTTPATTTTIPSGQVAIADAGFETGDLTGWVKGSQTGTLGSSIGGQGTGVTVFSGSRTFVHGAHGSIGQQTLPNGSPNPYYAPAVAAGSWTFSPKNNSYAVLLQPKSEQNFDQAMSAIGIDSADVSELRNKLTTQASASGFGSGNPTDAAWITREVQLSAGATYTMSWNYVGTDYVPFNDGSITSLVAVDAPTTPTITVNNYASKYALLGFTNPGTGDYSTNSYGSTGWQISTYKVSVTGTYKLGFAVFNLDDTALSPALMIDNAVGSTDKCAQDGSSCTSFGGVVSNSPTAPTVTPDTTTTTTTTIPAFFNEVQDLEATLNTNGSVFLNWEAPSPSGLSPYMYDVSWVDLNNGTESGGWGVWTYASNTSYTLGSFQFPNTTGYGPVRFKVRAGNAACVGEGEGPCIYGPYVSVDLNVQGPVQTTTTTTTAAPPPPVQQQEPVSDPAPEPLKPIFQPTETTVAPQPGATKPSSTTTTVKESIPTTTTAPEQGSGSNQQVIVTEETKPILDAISVLEGSVSGPEPTEEDKQQAVAIVQSVIESGLNSESATLLASSALVLASINASQAEAIFETISATQLTVEQAAEIVNAVQSAPNAVREAFEAVVSIFSGAFDSYTMLGSNITVGQRRTVVAVTLLTSTGAVAAFTGSSSPGSSGGSSRPSTGQDTATRRNDEEESESAGEISGDGVDWIRAISIYKYINGEKVMNWKAFIKKFAYGLMNMGFTLAGSLIVYLTLSGTIQKIAGVTTVLAVAAAMWLHMREPESE
jgi:hypothetical protein